MKLRNKKTGEIKDWDFGSWYQAIINPDNKERYECKLNGFIDRVVKFREEWEDVPEEPKEHWAIDQFGEPINVSGLSRLQLEKLHRLGNDFPSEKATMKAIEKLKAWQRLKDKGFRFVGWDKALRRQEPCDLVVFCDLGGSVESEEDIDLLFGGEE